MNKTEDVARQVAYKLTEAGFDAFLVGGCVRDMLLGRVPKDFDIVTSAMPQVVEDLFPKTLAVGKQFGVIVVLQDDEQVEVASYRIDGAYSDNRRPDQVMYALTVEEDVQRRDFTINGLLQRPSGSSGIVDYVFGRADLKDKLIRCIGDPDERFKEDALRMLRAIRFATTLNFNIELVTWKAIRGNRQLIKKVSGERVRDELIKILTAPGSARGVSLLSESGLLSVLFPEIMTSTFAWVIEKLGTFPPADPLLALATFLSEMGHIDSNIVLNRLKLSVDQTNKIAGALVASLQLYSADKWDLAKMKRFARLSYSKLARDLYYVDYTLKTGNTGHASAICARFGSLSPQDILPEPFITGDDLIVLGYRPGPLFKAILFDIETKQLNGDLKSKKAALEWIRDGKILIPSMKGQFND